MRKRLHGMVAGIAMGVLATVGMAQSPTADAPALSVTLQVPGDGFASYGVYNSDGTLVRALAAADPVERGTLAVAWDGTTDLGLPAEPGDYNIRGVWFDDPLKANYVMKVAISGDPPYVLDNGLGGWGANLGAAYDVTSNGKDVIVAFSCIEDTVNTGVQRMDATGKILLRYQTFWPWDGRYAVAMDDKNFYMIVQNRGLKRVVIGKWDIDNPKGKILADVPTGDHYAPAGSMGGMPWDRGTGKWTSAVRGLAVDGDRLFVPVLLDNKLFVVSAEDGKILHSVDVDSPRGVAARGGRVFLLSGTKLLELDKNGVVKKTIIDSLEDPLGVALDTAGNFYLSDRGKSQQVKVFSPRGELLRTIGKEGGRPRNGWYDPSGLLDPAGLTVGPDGDVWVTSANEDFQRVSVWNGQTGEMKREFFSTRWGSGQGKLNPDRTEMEVRQGIFADQPSVSSYKIDVEKGTWYPSWHQDMTREMMSQPEAFLGHKHVPVNAREGFADGRHPYLSFHDGAIRADNGKMYRYGPDFSIWLFDEKTTELKPASLIYMHRVKGKTPEGILEGEYDRGPNKWMTWSDLNGDGKMAEEEMRITDNVAGLEKTMRVHDVALETDLSLTLLVRIDQGKDVPYTHEIKRLSPREVRADGVPVYDWADLKSMVPLKVPSYAGGDGWKGGENVRLFDMNTAGGMYNVWAQGTTGKGVTLRLSGIDGDGWWASRNWRNSPLRFDPKTGVPSWLKLGRRAPGKAKRGEMYYPLTVHAAIDGFCFVNDTFAQTWVWTEEGLYIGRLYNEAWEGKHDEYGVFVESVASFAYKINGKVYAIIGDHGVWVHEVDLPELTRIDGGTVQLTPAIAAAAKPWDPDGPMPGKRPSYTAKAIYDFTAERQHRQQKKGEEKPDFQLYTINIDGKLDDGAWGLIEPMSITEEDTTVARVKVTFDKGYLYLAYDVTDPVGLRNAGTELPYSPFASGAYVDFNIAPDWVEPERENNLIGDVRVILARITGRQASDYQMAFYPLRETRHAKNPQTISSPAASRHFEDISPVENLEWASVQTDRGYTVEVKLPLRPIGLIPERNASIGFDVSVGFANAAGTSRTRALHWAGQSEAAVVDRPGSAALLPYTWGTLMFDRSAVVGD